MAATDADPHNLQRFVAALEAACTAALGELHAGQKRTHWMWFVFPQVTGLGASPTAQFYAICSRAEAEAYLSHPLLGARLRECAGRCSTWTAAPPSRSWASPTT